MVSTQSSVKSSENSLGNTRQSPSPSRRRACGTRSTVRATGFSLAQTGFSLAQSVASECVFSTAPRFFASIWRADAVHVFGRKIHVFDIVCKKIRPCCTACHGPPTTFSPPRFFSLSKAHTALWCAYLAGGINTRAAVSWFYN